MKPDIKFIYQKTRMYAITVGNVKKDAKLVELCDFGDSYGFLFSADDVFGNLYWCVEKDTYKPYSYGPNMDMEKFKNRKILPLDIVR